jgi:Uma2 family endonuclease
VATLFPPQGQWSAAEYLSLTNSTNRPVEFDGGRIEVLPMPTEAHQFIVRFLFLALHGFVAARQLGEVVFAPIRVRTLPDKYREPDLALMLAENDARRSNSYWSGADLVMEVVSDDAESRARDIEEKRAEYATAGIAEYWIVDPLERQITVLHLASQQYEEHGTFGEGEQATSNLLAEFSLDVAKAFAAAEGT